MRHRGRIQADSQLQKTKSLIALAASGFCREATSPLVGSTTLRGGRLVLSKRSTLDGWCQYIQILCVEV